MPHTTCTIVGCERRHHARGWCLGHYQRARRHGDPGPVELGHRDPSSYRAAHGRVVATLGPAADHTCACGAPATQWAYDHADPDERTGTANGEHVAAYSLSVAHYKPMCRPCHASLDSATATACHREHEFTPENTIIRRDGTRACRTCAIERDRAYRARKRAAEEVTA